MTQEIAGILTLLRLLLADEVDGHVKDHGATPFGA